MFKVLCINSKNRPNEIPTSNWIKKGEVYTVIEIKQMNQQGKLVGFKLEEIDLSAFFPYTYFSSERFLPLEEIKTEIEEEELELINK
jgi:hypothetical protein